MSLHVKTGVALEWTPDLPVLDKIVASAPLHSCTLAVDGGVLARWALYVTADPQVPQGRLRVAGT